MSFISVKVKANRAYRWTCLLQDYGQMIGSGITRSAREPRVITVPQCLPEHYDKRCFAGAWWSLDEDEIALALFNLTVCALV